LGDPDVSEVGEKSRQRRCPICGKPATKEDDPFCSKRCAQVDLNRWLSGTYVIPGKKVEDSADEEH
jgi:endogenous inhibitor of DNA gyrase (YacG/DUF329 family)